MLKVPPPIWTLIYCLVAAAISWLLHWPMVPGLPQVALGIAIFLAGWIVPVWAVMVFRRAGTELRPDSPTNSSLVTAGPYRFTRNPMYLGLVIVSLGVAVAVGAWPMFAVPIAVFATPALVHIPFEEAKMRRQFGGAYDDYVARVRRWI
jgi:protein-S-isoprenylcysteine O-methyltransferase Ste14